MKRIILFMATNVLILVTISIVMQILGIRPYLEDRGINYGSLLIFCLLWGMGGAFISLALSRFVAKMATGLELVTRHDENFGDLVEMVYEASRKAGLKTMPEVGVYKSADVNAFATGPSRNRSLVAFSTGALKKLNYGQLKGIAGHEVAHIANGDMVTMTLVQGVMNAFVMFFARILAYVIGQRMRESGRGGLQFLLIIVFEILFSFLAMFVVSWFSRLREYRADEGGANLMGRGNMISALQGLQQIYQRPAAKSEEADALATLKISGKTSGLMALLSTHPPLDLRIERLHAG